MSQSVLISTPASAPGRLLSKLPAQVHAQEIGEIGVLARDDRIRGARREGRHVPILEEQRLVGHIEAEAALAGEAGAALDRGPVGVRETRSDVLVGDRVPVETAADA